MGIEELVKSATTFEEARRYMFINLRRENMRQCPVDDDARCDIPAVLPCNEARCPVFFKVAGGEKVN